MFKRSFASMDRAGKIVKPIKKSYRDQTKVKMVERLDSPPVGERNLTSPIVTLIVGRDQRVFAAHEDVLSLSPFFRAALKGQFLEGDTKEVICLMKNPRYSPVFSNTYTRVTTTRAWCTASVETLGS